MTNDEVQRELPEPCPICHRVIVKDAHGGPHPSPGDHDPAYHVAKAYGTGWVPEQAPGVVTP